MILCGGGTKNSELVSQLTTCVSVYEPNVLVESVPTTMDYGIPVDAKECVSFAVLAAARMDGVPANLPQVTGAKRRAVLGNISVG